MKTIFAVVAAMLISMGQSMSQVADLTAPIGTQLRTFFRDDVPNNSVVKLLPGLYAVTPSILFSNLNAGNQFTGITIANKTNITILGVPGQTVIDGSSAPGEVLFITNCQNITIRGVTVRGWTNHNVNVLPLNSLLYAGVHYAMTDNLIVEDCIIERHFDHGIADAASGLIQVERVPSMSTNVFIRRNYFTDIGSFRTNTAGGVSRDGTAIVPTGGVVEDNTIVGCLRGIEPYTDAVGVNKPFRIEVRRNRLINMVDSAMPNFGTTNMHNSVIEFNRLFNDATFNYHGSNYGVTFAWSASGIFISGGRANTIRGNTVEGSFLYAYALFNSASKLDDCSITDNYAIDINSRGSQGYGFYLGEPNNTAANSDSLRRAEFRRNTAIRCQDAGIALWACRDSVFSHNRVIDCNLSAVGATFGAQWIVGYPGFSSAPLTNVTLMDNVVYKNQSGPLFAYYLADNISSGTFSRNEVVTNVAYTASWFSGGITNRSGYAVEILGPVQQYSAVIALPSIGVNSQFTTNFTAIGLTTNSFVESLRVPARFYETGNTTNVVYNAWCSNDTVYVKFSNNDAVTAAAAPSVRIIANTRLGQIAGQ